MEIVWVASLGLMGILLRYGIDRIFSQFYLNFPWGTLLINLLGSFLVGIIAVLGVERMLVSPSLRVGLMVGFCGGFTTFSSYVLQSFLLFEQRRYWVSFCYLFLSPGVGLVCTLMGVFLARSFSRV